METPTTGCSSPVPAASPSNATNFGPSQATGCIPSASPDASSGRNLPAGQRRLSVRLASDRHDLAAVQRLRYRVFHDELGASIAAPASGLDGPAGGLDADAYDGLCDHLLVIDEACASEDAVVGTYRLLRESVARAAGGFYSAGEFDLAPLTAAREWAAPGPDAGNDASAIQGGELLELGRSCVLPPYRTSATIALLWRGIAGYITRHRIGMMFGCASFPGTDPELYAPALSYLHHHHLAPASQRPVVLAGPRANGGRGVSMDRLALGSYDERRALLQLPPLVKGYMRVGALFGEGAYIDREFNTIDVCVVMPVERICDRYAARFSVAA